MRTARRRWAEAAVLRFKRLAVLFGALMLLGCAQPAAGPNTPYSPEDNGNTHDSGGGDGGGSSM